MIQDLFELENGKTYAVMYDGCLSLDQRSRMKLHYEYECKKQNITFVIFDNCKLRKWPEDE